MSVVSTEITLKNGADVILSKQGQIKADEVRQMTVQAIVDTGARTMVINEETRSENWSAFTATSLCIEFNLPRNAPKTTDL